MQKKGSLLKSGIDAVLRNRAEITDILPPLSLFTQ